jgi:hypothetical protein
VNIGTKSVLFGAHQFLLHPLFVAAAWWKLYGFPSDPRLWAAFAVHDLGYWGKPNMDGDEGERHPAFGAALMGRWFDRDASRSHPLTRAVSALCDWLWGNAPQGRSWYHFTLCHSRFMARRLGVPFSRLCVADKLAGCLEPDWLYLARVILTGEIAEYMDASLHKEGGRYTAHAIAIGEGRRAWRRSVKRYLLAWIEEHRDGRADTWTPDLRAPSARDEVPA